MRSVRLVAAGVAVGVVAATATGCGGGSAPVGARPVAAGPSATVYASASNHDPVLLIGRGDCDPVSFSPDGKTLAVGCGTRALLWDTAARKILISVDASVKIHAIAFSPDGKTFATVSSGEGAIAQLWNVATHQSIVVFAAGSADMAFSPDGTVLVTGGQDANLSLRHLATGQSTATVIPNGRMALSPDGRTIAAAGVGGTVRLWNIATGQALATLTGTVGPFSPDGKTVATGEQNGVVHLWDVATGRTTGTVSGEAGPVAVVAFTPDGRSIAVFNVSESKVRMRNVATGQVTATFVAPAINGAALSPDGTTVAVACADGIVRLWTVAPPA
jgi:WD40 repeat protein